MIEKYEVSDGLFIVSIPEINFCLQCAAPAESVKNLIKEGFIQSVVKDGVEFENGPNAILLCDFMIQNGEFSNLSEFPVLQMLYRQGMLIPNHINNNGLKPLLIGNQYQIGAQLEYIFRGNYGLVSSSELLECGIDSDLAQEIMNMKKQFAFGELKDTQELVDSCILHDFEKTHIRDGVYIQRVDINIFQIFYKNETVSINLNLKKDDYYKASYTLPQKTFKREYFSIINTGQGDGWDKDNPSMGSLLTFKEKLYLIDVVPNVRYILDSLGLDINEIDGVFLTHCHDDHLAGITSLLRSDKKVNIYAHPLVLKSSMKKISALIGVSYERLSYYIKPHNLVLENWNDIDDELQIKPCLSAHPVETTIFQIRVSKDGVKKIYGHYADILAEDKLKELNLTPSFYEEILKNYRAKLDLKKVDVGGGLIHGIEEDFTKDESSKIIFAHKSNLKSNYLQDFGEPTVLFEADYNYEYDLVEKYLKMNFSMVDSEDISKFKKYNIVKFKPMDIVFSCQKKSDFVYILLSGKINVIDDNLNDKITLTAGSIIGENGILEDTLMNIEVISKTHCSVLEIPLSDYLDFLNKYDMRKIIENRFLNRLILSRSKLFNQEISFFNFSKILDSLESFTYKDEPITLKDDLLYVIIFGNVEVVDDGEVLVTLKPGEHFGGIKNVIEMEVPYSFYASGTVLVYGVDANILKNIPIIRWKIFEHFDRLS